MLAVGFGVAADEVTLLVQAFDKLPHTFYRLSLVLMSYHAFHSSVCWLLSFFGFRCRASVAKRTG